MSLPFYRLQQIISPSLPIGAFTYSQGMEWAVECGWIKNREDLVGWLESCMRDSLATLDLAILARLLKAADSSDGEQFECWASFLYASRETSELRSEEVQRARAMVSILEKLPEAGNWDLLHSWEPALKKTQVASFALACSKWGVADVEALRGYGWAWLENMVSVAVKLVPLGQSDGQHALYELSDLLEEVVTTAMKLDDEEIGASTFALAIASSLHETQYCRLFRS